MKSLLTAALIGASSLALSGSMQSGEGAATPVTTAAAQPAEVDYSAAIGRYEMDWGRGRVAIYELKSVSAEGAEVTYSYDGDSRTQVLPVRNGRIIGRGWFPTARISGGTISGVTHNGNRGSVRAL